MADLHPLAVALLATGVVTAAVSLAITARRLHAAGPGAMLPQMLPPARLAAAPVAPAAQAPGVPGRFFDSLPVALIELELDGTVRRTNAAAGEALGQEMPRHARLETLLISLGRPVEVLVQAARNGASAQARVRIGTAGREATLQIVPGPRGQTLVAVLSDASELRKLEEQFTQSQKMEAVGKLAGGVAHDFNNLLTAISGHCDLLLLGKDISHPDYSDLMQVRQNGNRAASLVRQLLAFSRKQRISPEVLSVRDVISDAHYMLDRMIGETVSLRLKHGADLGSVRCDQQQLEQALMNLVVNARDAMPDGGTITISTRNVALTGETVIGGARPSAGSYVEIAVSDQGAGIPDGVIDRIFEPFFTTKPLGAGTGLGLSTVYGIVNQAGGFVEAENAEDAGARFRILLPRVEQGDAVPVPEAAAVTPDATGHDAVLLVEDEAPVRSFAARALGLRGYQVTACESAVEALDVLNDESMPIDLIVTDVMMPGMSGPGFAAEALEIRPGLPVIFISGYAEGSLDNDLEEKGFLFLPKRFRLPS